jgi:hypothetical protein
MKQTNKFVMAILLLSFLISPVLYAQDSAEEGTSASIVVVTKVHWNPAKTDGSPEEWAALEKEYHEKVTMKNSLILHSNFLTHFFTADNSESLAISTFATWEDIEKSGEVTSKLIEEGWPDEAERKAFFKKRNSYYSPVHSDQIYTILDGGKYMDANETEPLIYYIRKSHSATPDDAVDGEMKDLHTEFLENVVYKNDYIKAYYINRHRWGQDARDINEVFVLGSLADVENSFDKNTELINAHWPDEDARKAFFEKYNRYFSGWHGDFVYQSVPALIK